MYFQFVSWLSSHACASGWHPLCLPKQSFCAGCVPQETKCAAHNGFPPMHYAPIKHPLGALEERLIQGFQAEDLVEPVPGSLPYPKWRGAWKVERFRPDCSARVGPSQPTGPRFPCAVCRWFPLQLKTKAAKGKGKGTYSVNPRMCVALPNAPSPCSVFKATESGRSRGPMGHTAVRCSLEGLQCHRSLRNMRHTSSFLTAVPRIVGGTALP